jgi:hypothetical protein
MLTGSPGGTRVAIEQISVFIENETGGLADVVGVLAKSAVDIRAMSIADHPDFGIVRLIVDDTDRAAFALKDAGFTLRRTPVVAVLIPDRPGGLATTLDALRGIAVEYMYAFVHKRGDEAVVVFRFDDLEEAVARLRAAGARLLEAAEVQRL